MKAIQSITCFVFLTTLCISTFAKGLFNNQTIRYSKTSIFVTNINAFSGSKNLIENRSNSTQSEGNEYRLFNDEKYQILSNNGLIIYSKTWLVLQGKGPKPTELFYFSASATEPILPLTIANLESVYGKNQKFMYAVESLFRSDSELASYDSINKQFKLTFLYLQNSK